VPTWSGVAYVCFIVDAFSRRIVGWRVAAHMRTGMVLDALEMARWSRGTNLEGLVAHSDAGSQFTSIRYGERLATLGLVHWFNRDRIHSYLDDESPDQFEAAYAASQTDQTLVGNQ